MRTLYTAARYVAALLIIFYAFAKLNGAQFTVIDSQLDTPMGQVEPFWLAWYFFGYSPLYGNFIALIQMLAGVLLFFPRTTLLGACILAPVMANIVLIDLSYDVGGGLPTAVLISLCVLVILAVHSRELLDLFWTHQNSRVPAPPRPTLLRAGHAMLCLALVALPALYTSWVASVNNRAPTPIDGAWDIALATGTADVPTAIFFEHNRAYMAVFKYPDGRYAEHHFELDPATGTITIWEQWLRKGEKLFEGSYRREAEGVRLSGTLLPAGVPVTLDLTPRDVGPRGYRVIPAALAEE